MNEHASRPLPLAEQHNAATSTGSYFVSNYPPYPAWSPAALGAVERRFALPPAPGTPLGVYVHVPFCRKRCLFCYFKVYTDKNAREVEGYVEAVLREAEASAKDAAWAGRRPTFVYVGGGTPSYLSTTQLRLLFSGIRRLYPWHDDAEVTFECEPGTLSEGKLEVLKELGVTRLSLGVENFDDGVLETNGRAHLSKQIFGAYELARRIGFPQINLDLIAGMVGETDANWSECVRKTLAMAPDSVTIYQMEVPQNTRLHREKMLAGETPAIADWPTKRRWVGEAFAALEGAGYRVSSGYTMLKGEAEWRYRDELWRGADLLPLGVSSFGQLDGMHFQNEKELERYVARVNAGERPLWRGYAMDADERLVREFILQLKLGRLDFGPMERKFGVSLAERFAEPLRELAVRGLATIGPDGLTLSRAALLEVDRLLPAFFQPRHAAAHAA